MLFSFNLELLEAFFGRKIVVKNWSIVRLTPYQNANFWPKMAFFLLFAKFRGSIFRTKNAIRSIRVIENDIL